MTAVPVLRSAGRSERIFPVKSIVGATGCGGWKLQHLVRPTHPVSLRPGKSTLITMDTTSFAGKSALQSMVLMPGLSFEGLPDRAWETQERVSECTTPGVLWHLWRKSSVGSPIYTLCWIFFLLFSCRACKKMLDKEVSRGPKTCASYLCSGGGWRRRGAVRAAQAGRTRAGGAGATRVQLPTRGDGARRGRSASGAGRRRL